MICKPPSRYCSFRLSIGSGSVGGLILEYIRLMLRNQIEAISVIVDPQITRPIIKLQRPKCHVPVSITRSMSVYRPLLQNIWQITCDVFMTQTVIQCQCYLPCFCLCLCFFFWRHYHLLWLDRLWKCFNLLAEGSSRTPCVNKTSPTTRMVIVCVLIFNL